MLHHYENNCELMNSSQGWRKSKRRKPRVEDANGDMWHVTLCHESHKDGNTSSTTTAMTHVGKHRSGLETCERKNRHQQRLKEITAVDKMFCPAVATTVDLVTTWLLLSSKSFMHTCRLMKVIIKSFDQLHLSVTISIPSSYHIKKKRNLARVNNGIRPLFEVKRYGVKHGAGIYTSKCWSQICDMVSWSGLQFNIEWPKWGCYLTYNSSFV